ncbi:MAG: hypothetical protein AB8B56_14455 [Crocinitomicaceae bacterium]
MHIHICRLKKHTLLFIAVSFSFSLFSQNDFLDYDDSVLDKHFKAWNEVGFELSYCFNEQIDALLLSALDNESSLTYQWDSLQHHMSISTSEDGHFRAYSYDRRTGGNWHDYGIFLQMRMSDSTVIVHEIETEKAAELGTYEDASIYKIHEIKIESKTYYLTFAYGTHGSGQHHNLIVVYGELNGSIIAMPIFGEKNQLVITTQRMHKFEVRYNPKTKELSFNEMIANDESHWNSPSGKRTIWKLKSNGFQKLN